MSSRVNPRDAPGADVGFALPFLGFPGCAARFGAETASSTAAAVVPLAGFAFDSGCTSAGSGADGLGELVDFFPMDHVIDVRFAALAPLPRMANGRG